MAQAHFVCLTLWLVLLLSHVLTSGRDSCLQMCQERQHNVHEYKRVRLDKHICMCVLHSYHRFTYTIDMTTRCSHPNQLALWCPLKKDYNNIPGWCKLRKPKMAWARNFMWLRKQEHGASKNMQVVYKQLRWWKPTMAWAKWQLLSMV